MTRARNFFKSLWSRCCTLEDLRLQSLFFLLFPVAIGLLGAMGALFFRWMIELIHNTAWSQGATFLEQVVASPWWLVLLVPTAGGLIAGPIMALFAPEARGPGVPEVILSVAARHSTIRHRVTFLKASVTGLLIGCGASVGREGPVVQIGASVGSSLAQLFGLKPRLRRVCLASGVAAGIAATFNAPIAGTFFAIEIILLDIEISSVTMIIIAAITASVVSRSLWGELPLFSVEDFVLTSTWDLLIALMLGLLAGLAAIAFIRSITVMSTLFERLRLPEWLKPGIGGLGLGMIGLVLPNVMGIGYETVNLALTESMGLMLALMVLAGKMLATSLCIGSGMSGGVFAPSLVMGASLGTLVNLAAGRLFPALAVHPSHFALIGMGALVAGTTQAPITAIMTIFELTTSYTIILPLMVGCIASALLVRLLFGYSIYEYKLLRQGKDIVRGHDVAVLRDLRVKEFMTGEFETLPDDLPIDAVFERMGDSPYSHFVVLDQKGELAGVLSMRDLKPYFGRYLEMRDIIRARDLMTREVLTTTPAATLESGLQAFEKKHIAMLPVIAPEQPGIVIGVLHKDALLKAYDERVLKQRLLSREGRSGFPLSGPGHPRDY